jgi:allantoicase
MDSEILKWIEQAPKSLRLSAHKKHVFKKFLIKRNKENYLKINIYPDGGISRIRAFGSFK